MWSPRSPGSSADDRSSELRRHGRAIAPAYDQIGNGYGGVRREDPRLAAAIRTALGDAGSVVNVGAGAGSYEPVDIDVVAVEPAVVMIEQRPPGAAPAVRAAAESLPFPDDTFDAAMAVLTMQHLEAHRGFPPIAHLVERLPDAVAAPLPVPRDCADGFMAAFWARPEAYLDPRLRSATSPWHRLAPAVVDAAIARLRADLEMGVWDQRHGALRTQPELDVGLRLIRAPRT